MSNELDMHPHTFPDTAEAWLARLLSPECDAGDHAAFERWLAESPDNALAYADVEALHAMVAIATTGDEPVSIATPAAVAHASGRRSAARRHRHRRPAFAWAATLVVAFGAAAWGWMAFKPVEPATYATAIGERRTVELADGSTLALDADTSVRVSYDDERRQIELHGGRLQADVAHDPQRPFEVRAGSGVVRALGTTFQVTRLGDATEVVLLEGRVLVDTRDAGAGSSIELQAGQRTRYGTDRQFSHIEAADLDTAEGWLSGRLVFKDRRLADLLVEVNRYSHDSILLADPALGEIRVNGAFDAHDQGSLVDALAKGWGLHATRGDTNVITLSKARN